MYLGGVRARQAGAKPTGRWRFLGYTCPGRGVRHGVRLLRKRSRGFDLEVSKHETALALDTVRRRAWRGDGTSRPRPGTVLRLLLEARHGCGGDVPGSSCVSGRDGGARLYDECADGRSGGHCGDVGRPELCRADDLRRIPFRSISTPPPRSRRCTISLWRRLPRNPRPSRRAYRWPRSRSCRVSVPTLP